MDSNNPNRNVLPYAGPQTPPPFEQPVNMKVALARGLCWLGCILALTTPCVISALPKLLAQLLSACLYLGLPFIALLLAIHFALGRADPSTDPHRRKDLRLLMLDLPVALLVGAAAFFWLMPNRIRSFEDARRVADESKTQVAAMSVLRACRSYAESHDGQFPDSLPDLDSTSDSPARARFVYLGRGRSIRSETQRAVLLYSTSNFDGSGRVVGYADGSAEFVIAQDLPSNVPR